VGASFVGQSGEHQATFEKVQDLHSEAPESIALRISPQVMQQLVPGRDYVIAYIAYSTQRLLQKVEERKGGPVVINLPGAAPALLADSPELREILAWDLDETVTSPTALMPLIRTGLTSQDWQYQNFFLTELALRPPLHKHLNDGDREQIVALAFDPDASPYVPRFLIQHGDFLGEAFDHSVRSELARSILRTHTLQQDQATLYPLLIRTAMHHLGKHGNAGDAPLLKRWLRSNNVALVEEAMESLGFLRIPEMDHWLKEELSQSLNSQHKHQAIKSYQRRLLAIRDKQGW
ncbi:MAG: hypothetical protein MI750_09580, partial [Xanthomonadales bacterium]|nr:hypothetical protein [Xanthomonadales bacterium]